MIVEDSFIAEVESLRHISLPTPFQQIIHQSKYARWLDKEQRRETWFDTVLRYIQFFRKRFGEKISDDIWVDTFKSILNLEVFPSMRALWSAGKALEKDEVCNYNCSAITVNTPRAFSETFYLLLCGAGVGFSVERQEINKLPEIPDELFPSDTIIVVKDSKLGWVQSLNELISLLYSGRIPQWDLSLIRPTGARLKTFGGRACLSGDTVVYKDQDCKEITIEQLFEIKNSEEFWEPQSNHFKNVGLRSLNEKEGNFFINELIDVIDNGISEVYEITTDNGYNIRATKDHRFMNEEGEYLPLSEFSFEDFITVNGSIEFGTNNCLLWNAPTLDKIKSIEYSGMERVYDLVMQGPNHNFVANGFVSHNSGPRPLHDLFTSFVNTFKNAKGRKLNSFECHCLMTDIAATVQVGGSRRCLFSQELVELESGKQIPIDVVRIGDQIQSGDGSLTKVVNIFDNGNQEVVKLHLSDGTFFECTENHRWLVYNEDERTVDFIEARFLNDGDFSLLVEIDSNSHDYIGIESVEYSGEIKPVMDIEVDHPNHQFLAFSSTGAKGISHNSALISLSNLSDERMRDCKSGQWWERFPNLSFANNSVAYTEKPDIGIFMKEWVALYMSKSGERGIFNRQGAKNHVKKEGKRDWNHDFLLNPCGEVLLRNHGLCNLSSTIVRSDDTFETLKKKLTVAACLGTIQSDMTNFRYLSKDWKKNCLEEHLLGVSLTGIMDHTFLSAKQKEHEGFNSDLPTTLRAFKEHIYQENERFAKMIGIDPSVSVTVIKPEGNSSSLNNTSPGIHPRFSPFYIRSVRFDNHDPLAKMLKSQGVRNEPDIMKPETTTVFYFPIKSPDNSVFVKDCSALEQLELYKIYKENYTSHNPSITVYVKENEWLDVGAWVYKHFDIISGVSFLPNIEHNYSQLPYEEVDEETYLKELSTFPQIDWSVLQEFEKEDHTTGGQEYACLGGACMLD